MLLFVDCTLSRHFVMSLLEVAAKKPRLSHFQHAPHPSPLCTAELNLQHLIVWHIVRCVSDGSVMSGVDAPVTLSPLITDAK